MSLRQDKFTEIIKFFPGNAEQDQLVPNITNNNIPNNIYIHNT